MLGIIGKSHSCAGLILLPISCAQALPPSPSLPMLLTFAIEIIAIVTRATMYLCTVVIYIPLTARAVEFFSYFYWSFWYILYRNSHLGPLATFKLLYLFSCYWVGSLHVLNIGLFPDLFCKHSLFVKECCLALLIVSLAVGSFLVWCNSTCLFFAFVAYTFVGILNCLGIDAL